MRAISKTWGVISIPTQHGRTAIVTGANSGIGFHTALELGRAGARVIVACRDSTRGQDALLRMQTAAPEASFEVAPLDLANLSSVRMFASRLLDRNIALDILINNAGVMAVPRREVTVDGFERQFGTNHLGHFALTGLLLPALRRGTRPRVVSLSSGVAYFGRMKLDDLQSERRYSPAWAYTRSKLANLLFMLELGRRAPWLTSVAAHPGATHSNLQQYTGIGTAMALALIGQQADRGALPSLYAAVGDVASGEFYGPRYVVHMQGPPVEVRLPKRALDRDVAQTLWEASERLTGVRFDLAASSQPSS